jgi:NADH-quinone oxidoreductase subunit K
MLITILKQIAKKTKILFVLRNTLFFFSNSHSHFFKSDKKLLYSEFGLKNLFPRLTCRFRLLRIRCLPKTVIDKPLLLSTAPKAEIHPAFFKFSFKQRRILVETRVVIRHMSMMFCVFLILFVMTSVVGLLLENLFGEPLEVPDKSQYHRLNFGFFLVFSSLIFSIGAFGIAFNRKNILLLLISVEIMFLGINLVFISGYIFLQLELGLVYALISLSISAAEAAIGFGLITASFRNLPDTSIQEFSKLKG